MKTLLAAVILASFVVAPASANTRSKRVDIALSNFKFTPLFNPSNAYTF
ncbi:hypothetical protein ACVWZA_001516 [Sphingomonas sp. UYAg733]